MNKRLIAIALMYLHLEDLMDSKAETEKVGVPIFFASITGASFGGAIVGMFPHSGVASALGTMFIGAFWGMLVGYLLFGSSAKVFAITLNLGVFGGFIWGIFRPWEELLKAIAVHDGGLGDAALMAFFIAIQTVLIGFQIWVIRWIFGFFGDRRG
jgi:hypothetical protein